MSKITMVEAVNLALDHAMESDPDVVMLGEDIGVNGGVFRATQGLKDKYGFKRVMDTPLAETLIAGISIGMAAQGLKPVAEIQFMGFIFPTMEQLICHAARMRNRTRGRLSCPMVLRAPFGGGIHAPEHHSESTEALFAHIPGLRVVIPSSPVRAYGLLRSAINEPDPVIFLEPKRIYRASKQEVDHKTPLLPLDKCFTLKQGQDVTLVSWGASVKETMEAANTLEQHGVSTEVIDVATIKPLDMETILTSVQKTGRCVIVHEACKSFGAGAEIAASLAEQALMVLKAPVERVTGFDTIMPYYRMENHYLPSPDDIMKAALKTLSFH
ncbi:alpha-ketoacid dehydrogenase subunit beta [Endozoicomonas euniceicola]|uniref:3-methyl-2-oxobutanoate dehydrogenase (2-methylpropanoyl-transferring) n=1 Tax=Endozoicomonas euniceicola TaxID=1234143 RepID=A0ABY6H0X8_9GAMM|nr:alpha-ketoacid dehydrogenase subunit beta [Endozoicomonas euniceicola]UYM18570.1 alpha-ketoacid dehydrogenase subunit beta [Endozoicomonas euniceicola]